MEEKYFFKDRLKRYVLTQVWVYFDFTLLDIFIDTLVQIPGSCAMPKPAFPLFFMISVDNFLINKNVLQLLYIVAHEIIESNSVSENTHDPWKVSGTCCLLTS